MPPFNQVLNPSCFITGYNHPFQQKQAGINCLINLQRDRKLLEVHVVELDDRQTKR